MLVTKEYKNKNILNRNGRIVLEAVIIVPVLMIFILVFMNFSLKVYNHSMVVMMTENKTSKASMESFWNDGKQLVKVLDSCEDELGKVIEGITKGVSPSEIKTTYDMGLFSASIDTQIILSNTSLIFGDEYESQIKLSKKVLRPCQELNRVMFVKYLVEKVL